MWTEEQNYLFVKDQWERSETGWLTLSRTELLDYLNRCLKLAEEGNTDGWKHLEEPVETLIANS